MLIKWSVRPRVFELSRGLGEVGRHRRRVGLLDEVAARRTVCRASRQPCSRCTWTDGGTDAVPPCRLQCQAGRDCPTSSERSDDSCPSSQCCNEVQCRSRTCSVRCKHTFTSSHEYVSFLYCFHEITTCLSITGHLWPFWSNLSCTDQCMPSVRFEISKYRFSFIKEWITLNHAQPTIVFRPQKGAQQPPLLGPFLLCPNGWMDQDTTRYGGRPRPRRHCVRWGPSYPYGKEHSSPHFSAHFFLARSARSPIWATAELLLTVL